MLRNRQTWKMAGALALALATTTAGAQAQNARVSLNGQPLATSVPPILRNGSTFVPMRDIFEALGATVVWNNSTQEINAQRGDTRIWLQIGNRTARVGQEQRWLSQAPFIYSQSTLVPLRFVSEALGANVDWDGSQRLVRITTNGNSVVTNPYPPAGEQVAGTITIPAGVVVPVTLDTTLSSATAQVGDAFTATVKTDRVGDSEFPPGTKLRGRVTQVRRLSEGVPGVLGIEFRQAILPDGRTVIVNGDLASLDDENIVRQNDGRIVAKPGKDGTDLKIVGIGAAAGFILGKVLDKNELITAILGAAGGYLYDRSRDKGKEQEAVVQQGTTLGVRLTSGVTYTDTSQYWENRRTFLY